MDFVLHELPCDQGWALLAGATQNNAMVSLEMVTDGYIGQEVLAHGHRH